MPSPERSPRLPPGSIAEKKGGDRFAIVPTHIPGVSLRVEPDVEVDILRKTVEELTLLVQKYAERYFQILKLTSQQKGPNEEIKTLAQTHEGLRGVQSEEDNFILNVIPRDSSTWDHQLLKESAGIAYSSVVHQELVVSISVPFGFQTERGPIEDELLRQVLTQALIDLGLKEDDVQKIMKVNVIQRVDEKTLEKMIADRQVALLEGTRQIERTWAITLAPLRKSPES